MMFVSNGTVTVPAIGLLILFIIVYFKYIKPFYERYITAQDQIRRLSEVAGDFQSSTLTSDTLEKMIIGIKLLEHNKGLIESLTTELEHMKENLNALNKEFDIHDRNYEKQLNTLMLEFAKLTVKVETNLYSVRGVK